MSRSAQNQIGLTKNIKHPNSYIQAIYTEYKDWVLDEVQAPKHKGQWQVAFKNKQDIDLEIGPGTGHHFSELCLASLKKNFLAIEIKYKPLIQTIRRVRKNNSNNAKVIRYNACLLDELFGPQEINNVYIHFPDPWLKKRRGIKHQLLQLDFCNKLYKIQKKSSFLDFKTDSLVYFKQSVECLKQAGYQLQSYSEDIYLNKEVNKNRLSQFELIFVTKKQAIRHALFVKI